MTQTYRQLTDEELTKLINQAKQPKIQINTNVHPNFGKILTLLAFLTVSYLASVRLAENGNLVVVVLSFILISSIWVALNLRKISPNPTPSPTPPKGEATPPKVDKVESQLTLTDKGNIPKKKLSELESKFKDNKNLYNKLTNFRSTSKSLTAALHQEQINFSDIIID